MPIILYNGGVAKGYNVKVGKIGKVDKMGKMGRMGKMGGMGRIGGLGKLIHWGGSEEAGASEILVCSHGESVSQRNSLKFGVYFGR